MNVITGLRRSGTSMLMYALKEAGLDIAGEKFNGDNIDGNPNGYWEIPKICKDTGLVEKIDGDVVKIMFEALSFSDPKLIDKTVAIFREPRRVLYSIMQDNQIDYRDIFIVKNTIDIIDAIGFLQDKEHMIVFYENILENPEKEMKAICEFMGVDYKKASKVIDKKLNRSKESEEYKYVDLMERIYELLKRGGKNNIDKILAIKPIVDHEARILMDIYDKTNKI